MSKADAAAAILWVGATLYAVFGGADFGAGLWDLVAGDAERGERPRALIQRSITPVWEANHVWLIFILVVLWTAFPEAFSAVMTTLYVPLTLAAVGIVLRGAGFAFRKSIQRLGARRAMGATFAVSSVLTPFFMGTVVGAVAAGNVPAAGNGDAFSSWIAPLPLLTGALFVLSGAYLAAVFLVSDARRAVEADLEDYFARRALGAALAAGAVAVAGIFALRADARYVYDGLTSEGLPLVALSALCGLAVLAMLLRGARRGLRPLAIGAVVAVIWGWGVAQFPYLLPTSLRIDQAAAPGPTLDSVLVVFGIAAVVVIPSLGLLYWLTQRDLLEGEH
jgi:cytochrome d ubiquinol oxidase subunit II